MRDLVAGLIGAVVGAAVVLATRDGDPGRAPRTPVREVVDIQRELADVRAELARREADATRSSAATPPPPLAPDVKSDPEAEIKKLREKIDGMFERGEGREVLELLDELVAIGEVTWPLAAELWVRIDEDLADGPDSKLGFSKWIEVAGHLESPAMRDVFVWALSNDAPVPFREGAIYNLPWTQDSKKTLQQFGDLLKETDEPCLVVALVRGLRVLENDAAHEALLRQVQDRGRKPATRAHILVHLAYQSNQWAKPVLERIARTDGDDESVRTAAAAALIAFDPPATGLLVAAVEARGVRAGLRTGDIILQYAERRTTKRMHLGQEINRRKNGRETIAVEIIRDGQRLTLRVPPGGLGLITRDVKKK